MKYIESDVPVSVVVVDDSTPIISKKSVIEELRALQMEKLRANAPIEESPTDFTLKSLKTRKEPENTSKKKKKGNKKKKASTSASSVIGDLPLIADNLSDEETESPVLSNGRSLLDIIDGLDEDDEERRGLREIIIDEQRNSHESRRKDGGRFTKKFADQLTVLYDMLGESNEFSKLLSKQVKSLLNSKTRGASRGVTSMAEVALASHTNRLAVLKEINSINKTIADLELKEENMNARNNTAAADNKEYAGTQFLQSILSAGRNTVLQQNGVMMATGAVSANTGSFDEYDDDDEDLQYKAIQELRDQQSRSYTDYENEHFDTLIEQRLEEEDNPFRSRDGSLYIKYENDDVKINIKRCIDTQEWEFVAINKYNQIVPDYPLPDSRSIGKISFSQDGKIATDERGRSYKVIEYFSHDDKVE